MIWLDALHATLKSGCACVLVTVASVQGSAPRHVGARMLVTRETLFDTIGGGALEQDAIHTAQNYLSEAGAESLVESKTLTLGSDLSQCCGGKVTLNFEYHPACVFNVVVFGAGHVAQSLAKILAEVQCRVSFYDSRKEWLSKLPTNASNVSAHELGKNAFLTVEQCPDNAFFLVMTHSHELDFDLVEAILSRGDSAFCGLIASKSKANRFESRLSRKGFTQSELQKLTAPVGEKQDAGELPMEVAVSMVHTMLKRRAELFRRASVNASINETHLTANE